MTTVDVLRAARELYAQAPSHASEDEDSANGTVCVLMATEAAARMVGADDGGSAADCALYRSIGLKRCIDLIPWNAENSTETVLAAFDAAIEASS